jgi:FKBP12-rapamycin complex-associated protein
MQLYSEYDMLSANLGQLSDRNTSLQQSAAKEIRAHVEASARELSLVRFANFENELYASLFLRIISGDTITEKLGGILAIRELITCTSAAAEQKVMTFANTLSNALKANTDYALIELIAVALGDMARNSPVAQVDYVESELNQALYWLRDTQSHSHRRFAACAVLQQLAENAPTVFFVRTKEFFDLIWKPLRDPKEQIRMSAAAALSACLAVLRQRTYHLQWYCNIYEQIHEGFRKNIAESVHGSLLVVEQMLKHTGDFMVPRFKEMCKAIIALKEHRSKVVRGALLSLLPALAQFCPDAFARTYLDESVEIVVLASKVQELRQPALLAMGHLCRAVGPYLASRVDELVSVVIESLTGSGRKKVASEALRCVSDMVQGLGAPFHPKILILLDPMFQSGLTSELIETLSVISNSMPNQRREVEQRLLQEATKVLGGDAKLMLSKPTYLYSWSHQGQRYHAGAEAGNGRSAAPYTGRIGKPDALSTKPSVATGPHISDEDVRGDNVTRDEAAAAENEQPWELGQHI